MKLKDLSKDELILFINKRILTVKESDLYLIKAESYLKKHQQNLNTEPELTIGNSHIYTQHVNEGDRLYRKYYLSNKKGLDLLKKGY